MKKITIFLLMFSASLSFANEKITIVGMETSRYWCTAESSCELTQEHKFNLLVNTFYSIDNLSGKKVETGRIEINTVMKKPYSKKLIIKSRVDGYDNIQPLSDLLFIEMDQILSLSSPTCPVFLHLNSENLRLLEVESTCDYKSAF